MWHVHVIPYTSSTSICVSVRVEYVQIFTEIATDIDRCRRCIATLIVIVDMYHMSACTCRWHVSCLTCRMPTCTCDTDMYMWYRDVHVNCHRRHVSHVHVGITCTCRYMSACTCRWHVRYHMYMSHVHVGITCTCRYHHQSGVLADTSSTSRVSTTTSSSTCTCRRWQLLLEVDSKKAPYILSKESYILSKESYILSKEPYIHFNLSKDLHIPYSDADRCRRWQLLLRIDSNITMCTLLHNSKGPLIIVLFAENDL